MEPFDVVVVGAGSGGCVVASRLSEDPACRVLLLEAGHDLRPGDRPAAVDAPSFFDAAAEPALTWPDLEVVRSSAQGRRVYARGRGVGGSSVVNAMIAIPGEPGDYDRWAELGAEGWGWREVAPWFARTQLALAPAAERELGPIARALRAAWPHETELVPLTRDAGGRRVTVADAYLEAARGRPNLTVRADALVDRVVVSGGRVTGVRLAGGDLVAAGRVVLAAGAIHSPAILLRSGVDRRGIGRNLKDHPSVPITLQYAPGRSVDPATLAVAAIARFGSGERDHDLQLLPLEHLGRGAPGYAMVMTALMQVESAGRVELVDDDPLRDPDVDFAMLSDERDRRRLRVGGERTLELLDHPAFRDLVTVFEPDLSDDGLLAALGDYVHASGTCGMGRPDDPDAVVDPDGAVIGTTGLFVADASVFPDLPRANTHLPVVMVAERLSARWKVLRNQP